MPRDFPESDWKLFRELRKLALERFCERTLNDIVLLASDSKKPAHDRYIEVYRFVEERDREIAETFDNPRRSQALFQLASMSSLGLIMPEELSPFTQPTRDSVNAIAGISHTRRRGRR